MSSNETSASTVASGNAVQVMNSQNQTYESGFENDPRAREVMIKFRWYVTVPTTAAQVLFNCPFSKVPIALAPKKLNGSDIYESSEMMVPCGTYNSCTLMIDSTKHILEVVEIKHYSFEVDLYIDENDEEELATISTSYSAVSKQPATSSASSRPSAEVITKQCDLKPVAAAATYSEATKMDDVIEDESQPEPSPSKNLRRLNALESLLRQQIANRGGVVEDSDKSLGKSSKTLNGSDNLRIGEQRNLMDQNGRDKINVSNHSGLESSKIVPRIFDSDVADRRFEPIHTPSSITSSSRPELEWQSAADEIVQENSISSSFVSEPELKQFAAAVCKSAELALAKGVTVTQVGHGGRQRNADCSKESLLPSRSRSVETLFGRKSLNDASFDHLTHHQGLDLAGMQSLESGNLLHSTPQLVSRSIAEQRTSSNLGSREKVNTSESSENVRLPSQSSTEVYEKVRTAEPTGLSRTENVGRLLSPTMSQHSVPTLRSPLVTSRTTPIGSGLARTTTPYHVPLCTGSKETQLQKATKTDEIVRQEDLEDTIQSLKKLVKERDTQIEQLKKENTHIQSLITEAQQHSKENEEKRVRELIRDKENLATQLWKVKQDFEKLTSAADKKETVSHEHLPNNGLDNFSSEDPSALQRKLGDLHGDLQDLQEANETASAKLEQAEKIIAALRNENNTLCTTSETSLGELYKQNHLLKEQLHRLQTGRWMENFGPLQEEIQVLREDLRVLRDKNHLLVQDNIRLTEYIKDLQQFNSHVSLPQREGCHGDYSRLDGIHLVSWIPRSKDEKENYNASGQRIKTEPSSSIRIEGPVYVSDSKDLWSKRDVLDRALHAADGRPFTGDMERPRHDSPKSDTTLISRSHLETPSDYDNRDYHFKNSDDELLQSAVPLSYDRTRRWSATRQTVTKSPVEIDSSNVPLLNRLPLLNASSHITNCNSSNRTTSVEHKCKGGSDFKPVSDSFISSELKLDMNSKKATSGPDVKRLSICSNSTENILLEADMMLSASRSALKQKLVSVPLHEEDIMPSSQISQLNDQMLKGANISESRSNSRSFLNELTFPSCSKRPFAPRMPSDINIGDLVKFSRNGGHISKGQVKFIGRLPGKTDTYLGVELDNEMGKHDGVFEGTRYFQCKPNKGVFVAFCKVVMAWCD